jgi:hypothetical protein
MNQATATLDDVKTRLRAKYIGRAGIHGFGIRRSRNAVCVYLSKMDDEQRAVLREIEREAAPYSVLAIEESPPSIAPLGSKS